MDRFTNVDLHDALLKIAECNTFFHLRNDLDISIDQIQRGLKINDPTAKSFIWISYVSGIDCYSEREVFLRDTRCYNGVKYHAASTAPDILLAYAVEAEYAKDGKIFGKIDVINIKEYAAHVRENAIDYSSMRLYLTDGGQQLMSRAEFDLRYPANLPPMMYWEHEPENPAALKALVDAARKLRDNSATQVDLWSHERQLYDNRYIFHAERLMEGINKLDKPNSPDRQSYTTPLNGRISAAFNSEQLGNILRQLPFKNPVLSVYKDGWDMHLLAVPRRC